VKIKQIEPLLLSETTNNNEEQQQQQNWGLQTGLFWLKE